MYELSSGDVAAIEARELRLNLPLSGSLTPLDQATVKSKVSGVVLETAVQEGMSVAAGQVIARLDAADQRARVAQQQAALDEASARLSLAKKNNANSQALLKQNYISQNSYDTTQNSVELAQASVNAMRAQLELARIALADTVIRAPLAGVVSKRHVQAGEKVAPDMPVFTIVNLRQLTLEAQVPASEVPRVKIGQEVRFKVDGFAQRDFAGKVARISPTTEAGSRSMLVYISVDNSDARPARRHVRQRQYHHREVGRDAARAAGRRAQRQGPAGGLQDRRRTRWWRSRSRWACATRTKAWPRSPPGSTRAPA